jgi:hypothetical protein
MMIREKMKRKIAINKEEAKKIKKLLVKCKNKIERVRVMIVSTYI